MLDLYLHGELVARTALRNRGRNVVVEYADSVSTKYPPETCLLSCSLPTPGPGKPAASRAFLEGLLPEGDALRSMAASVRDAQLDLAAQSPATPADALHLLAEFGRECAGAVAAVPAGSAPPGTGRYQPVDEQGIATLLSALPAAPLGTDRARDVRMSLAGAQPKLLLAHIGDQWFLPAAGAASTHILKPTGIWPLSADNEAIVLELARRVGLTSSRTWVQEFAGRRTLVTERFDRTVVDADRRAVLRHHQEDICQALAIRPKDKYEIGRVSDRIAPLLRRLRSANRARLLPELLRQTAFRAIAGDEDNHGKNYGLLLSDGLAELTPLYDSLSTLLYPELSGRLAAPIGRQVRLAAVDLTALIEEGQACSLQPDVAERMVLDLAADVRDAVESLNLPADPQALEAVTTTIRQRAERLLNRQPMGVPDPDLYLSRGNRDQSPPLSLDEATRRASGDQVGGG